MGVGAMNYKLNIKGFSLVEMMFSLTISVIFLAAATTVMVKNKQDFRPAIEITTMSQSAVAVLDMMSEEIRQAGFFGENSAFEKRNQSVDWNTAKKGEKPPPFANHMFGLSDTQNKSLFALTQYAEEDASGIPWPASTAIEGYEGDVPNEGFYPSGTLNFDDPDG